MIRFNAKNTNDLKVLSGTEFILENLTVAVVPPNLNMEEFIILPPIIQLLKVEYPTQEGSFESHFHLRASARGQGFITLGYKNLDNNSISVQKEISLNVN